MATATARPSSAKPPVGDEPRDHGDALIGDHLEAVRAALWRSALAGALLRLAGFVMLATLAFAVVDQWIWSLSVAGRLLVAATVLGISGWWIAVRVVPLLRMRVSREYAAFSVEHDAPQLRHALTSYVTLREDRDAPGLRGIVVRSIGARAAKHLSSTGLHMPAEATGNFRTTIIVLAIFALLALYAAISPKNTLQSLGRLALPIADIAPPTRVEILEVLPGDVETLFGRPVKIDAHISGLILDEMPRIEVDGPRPTTLEMTSTGTGDRYSGTLPADLVDGDFQYTVVAGDARSARFDVVVRDEPTLMHQGVSYTPPRYTELAPRTSASGSIDGVEGTRVTVTARANRPIARGRIEFNPRTVSGQTRATAGFGPLDISDDGRTVSATWHLRSPGRDSGSAAVDSYRLRVWDSTETENSDPVVYSVRVIPDLPPEVRITVPATWPKDVPLGTQQLIEVRAADPDYGLTGIQLRIRRGTQVLEQPELFTDPAGARGNQLALYRFRPDELGLRAGELVTVEAVATDNRTALESDTAEPNTTVSDPVELRIVAPPRQPQSEDGDGLQPKDDAPATGGQSPESQGSPDSGGGESSGSEGSGEGQSGEGQTGEGQSGEGQSGEGQSGVGQSGEGQSGEGQSGVGQSGEGQSGEGQSGEGQSGEGQSGVGQTGAGQTGEGQTGEDPSGDGGPSGDGTAGDQPAGGDLSGQQPTDASAEAGSSGAPGDGSDAGTPGDGSTGDGSTGDGSMGDGSPATSDGEAFERIREYLNQRQPQSSQSSETDGSASSSGDSTESGDPSDIRGPTDTGDPTETGDAAETGNPTETGDPSEFGDPSGAGDSPNEGDPSGAGDPSSNGERPGAGDTSAGSDPSSSPSGASDSSGSGESAGSRDPAAGGQPSDEGAPSGTEETSGDPDADAGSDSGDRMGDQDSAPGSPGAETQANGSEASASPSGADPSTRSEESATEGNSSEGNASEGNASEENSLDGSTSEANSPEGSGSNGNGSDESGSEGSPASENAAAENSGDSTATPEGTESRPDGEATESSGSRGSGGTAEGDMPPGESTTESSDGPSQAGAGGRPNPSGNAIGNADQAGAAADAPPPPPDPVDVEAARQATDLVLDALRNQRDNPDPELLDRLGWTPEQLRRFMDRWQNARQLSGSDAAAQSEYEEALKSLGIRNERSRGVETLDQREDALRNMRDAGGRTTPPPQFRDSIEAVLRSVNR